MRRLLAGLGLALLATALPGCEDTATPERPTPDPEPITNQSEIAVPAVPELPADHDHPPLVLGLGTRRLGDLDALEEARIVRILTVYGPGRYYLDGANEAGYVASLAGAFEEFLNERLQRAHLRVHVVVVPVARDRLLPALLEGRGDLVAADLTVTPERLQDVDFSRPLTRPFQEVVVTGPSAPNLERLEDLAGQSMYVRHSSSYRESLQSLNRRFAERGLEPVTIEAMPELLEDEDLVEMVNGGLLPWTVVDDYRAQHLAGVFDDIAVREDLALRRGGRIAWALRKGSPRLLATVNEFLDDYRQGTLLGNILINRYFKHSDWAADALSNEDYRRFQELVDIFRTYGEQYGIDHLLATAQGYQESRLDQAARSSTGAIGVMQLLPSTARDPNVAIEDIHRVDSNIHAGVKYLRYLRDRYFDDPAIPTLDRTLMALAAYNAGPTRVQGLRARAAEAGYDPNRWFDNVEVIAARDIGRETVQYVANIYKYYVTYLRVTEQRALRREAREAAGVGPP